MIKGVRKMHNLEKKLRIGIIQTTLNNDIAWRDKGKLLCNMNNESENMVMEEIRRGFKEFYERGTSAPKIVLIPEYSIPHSGIKRIKKFAKAIDAVVIGGCDLFVDAKRNASNKGIIVIPNKWPKTGPAQFTTEKYFGKTYFSKTEIDWFEKLKLKASSEVVNYIINAGEYGNIGIAICADFYDLERFVIYKGRIHHLIIIAYNRDNKSFESLATALSRLLMCNVVICNTGHYGDSLAFSPYSEEYKRMIYRNTGAGLFAAQVIELPLKKLDEEQNYAYELYNKMPIKFKKNYKPEFKWPPGYKKY